MAVFDTCKVRRHVHGRVRDGRRHIHYRVEREEGREFFDGDLGGTGVPECDEDCGLVKC